MSIQNAQPDPRDLRYLQFVAYRRDGSLSDADIAAKLHLESPHALYRQLSNDGYPVCSECGATHVGQEHCKQGKDKLKTWGHGGQATELPAANRAASLFRDALFSLERDISLLSHRREYLQEERFVAQHVFSGEAGESFQRHFREEMPEALWRAYCQQYGADPERDFFDVPVDYVDPGGVSQSPPEPLTRLIAVYVLSGLPVDLLVNVLHLDPERVDADLLNQHINGKKLKNGKIPGLRTKAEDVAKLVRGRQRLRTGRTTGELSRLEEEAAAYIQGRRAEGASDTDILQELREGHGFSRPVRFGVAGTGRAWPDITMADLVRLGKLELGESSS